MEAAQADGWHRGPGRVGAQRRKSRSRARLDHAREAEGNPAELSVWIKVQQIKSGPTTEEAAPTTPAVAQSAIAPNNGSQVEQLAGVEPRVKGTNGGVLVG
jgi:hypothetical protein